MRPAKEKPYQGHTFALRNPLELHDDDLELLEMDHRSSLRLLVKTCKLLPHAPQWESLS
jgi:hypothetical protein